MRIDRREFLKSTGKLVVLTSAAALAWDSLLAGRPEAAPNYKLQDHWWGFAIDIEKCIGCGNCVRACKTENGVPLEPYYFRTWVERYDVPGGDIEHPRWTRPTAATLGSRPGTSRGMARRTSSCRSSATTAPIPPACKSAPSAPPLRVPTEWS